MDKFAQVLVPLPLNATFTYRIPPHLADAVRPGHRVIVPFGSKKFYTGIVVALVPSAPEGFDIKDISYAIDTKPVVRHPQLKLWEWIADYYLCAEGEVFKAAIPAGLKLESETFVEINPDFELDDTTRLSEREAIVYQTLDHEGALNIAAIASKTGLKNLHSTVNALIERGVVIVSEKLIERYRPKRELYVSPTFTRDEMPSAFERVKGARKQETLLLALIEMTQKPDSRTFGEIPRATLLERADCTPAVLKALVDKEIATVFKKEINRFAYDGAPTIALPRLSAPQAEALDSIHRSWLEHDITLLHGVTSSGKTEVYQHLIADVMRRGRQALFLVPEIALTTQLTRRLQAVFGDSVIVYHSKFSDNERVDIWRRLLDTTSPCVVIGARSSIFLPFASLGLVIIDEEHEQSYKQFDPAPRYNARDAAIVLASMHGAKILLGSATPSIETYYKATTGKFGLVSLTERYGSAPLPTVTITDMKRQRAAKRTSGTFALDTVAATREALEQGHQAILFQPRRGFSPLARCRQCAWTPHCSRCDVPLTYHRDINQLVCHYCGSMTALPRTCPQCHEPAIETLGYGTERVEEEVAALFPGHAIARLDLDSTRNKLSYLNIINDFSSQKSRILVGTQMVTKGLDFGNVSIVAVLNADSLINFPDFRAGERAFNTLQQVAGRAGRREDTEGHVIIQTSMPEHPIFGYLTANDYLGFYDYELAQRRQYFYPPFSRIIYVYLKHRDKATIQRVATAYTDRLRMIFGNRVYGPERPAIERINNWYIRKIMLKVEVDASMKHVKTLLKKLYDDLYQDPTLRGVALYYDVDPM